MDESKPLGSPEDYWPVSPDEIIKKVTMPEGLHQPLREAFNTYMFAEAFTEYEQEFLSWEETRELFWKRWRRSVTFRLMSVVQVTKSKRDFVDLLLTNQRFVCFLYTPTRTPSERAEERLKELLTMRIITDGQLEKDVIKVLSSIAKERESGDVDEEEKKKDPFEGMPPALIELLKRAVKSE